MLKQILAISAPFIITMIRGFSMGFSTTLLPDLKNSGVHLSTSESSWIASILIIGLPIGGFICGKTINVFGRKICSICIYFVTLISWMLFLLPVNFTDLLIARLISGITIGYSAAVAYVYVAEVSDPKYRGIFLSVLTTGASIGMFLIHAINSVVNWKISAIIASVFPVLCIVIAYFVPESPQWLLSNGDVEKGKEVFYWLRGNTAETEKEWNELIDDVQEKEKEKEITEAENTNIFKNKLTWKLLLVILVITYTIQGSGYNYIEFYSVTLAKEAFGENEYLITLIMDFLRIVFCSLACNLSKKVNRRPHIIISSILSAFCMIAFGLSIHLNLDNKIQITFLLLYISFMSAGLSTMSISVMVELCPFRLRGPLMGCSEIVMCTLVFTFVKVGPHLIELFGMFSTFSFYGVNCLLGTLVLYFILPETKDKSLSELEHVFK